MKRLLCFNSRLVRLAANFLKSFRDHFTRFNSRLVRLAARQKEQVQSRESFQFQIGAIGRIDDVLKKIGGASFNSRLVRLAA